VVVLLLQGSMGLGFGVVVRRGLRVLEMVPCMVQLGRHRLPPLLLLLLLWGGMVMLPLRGCGARAGLVVVVEMGVVGLLWDGLLPLVFLLPPMLLLLPSHCSPSAFRLVLLSLLLRLPSPRFSATILAVSYHSPVLNHTFPGAPLTAMGPIITPSLLWPVTLHACPLRALLVCCLDHHFFIHPSLYTTFSSVQAAACKAHDLVGLHCIGAVAGIVADLARLR